MSDNLEDLKPFSSTVLGKLQRYTEQVKSSDDMYGLVVDGGTLTLIMPYEENKDLLYQVLIVEKLIS